MNSMPMQQSQSNEKSWRDIFYTARDGLRLYARHYAVPDTSRRPLLCLPGLTRNSKDFHDLAMVLSGPRSHRRNVYALDYRGRGRSDYDSDWKNYSIINEMLDVLDFMTVMELHDVAVLGTSRGGLIAMVMATVRPTSVGAVILNDIGPVIDPTGLARIIAYVGRIPLPTTWEEATQAVKGMSRRQFTAISDDEWPQIARQMFNDENGNPVYAYDRALSKSISVMEGPLPDLWPQFQALYRVPVLALRGENSDLLSIDTLNKMRARHPNIETRTVPGQGHAPFLKDEPTISLIGNFLTKCDEQRQRTDAHGQPLPV